jgi:uncharacterized membrane protein
LARDGFTKDFRRFFFRGLAAVLPPLLTVAIIVYLLSFIDDKLVKHVNALTQWVVVQILSLHREGVLHLTAAEGADPLWDEVKGIWRQWHPWLWSVGLILTLALIYIFGRFVASFIGRSIWTWSEQYFRRLPLVKAIYPNIKQVTDFLLAERKMEFSRVVAVEYPRKGIWSVGLATGPAMRTLIEGTGHDLITVFIPSSPTPFTGYTITLKRDEAIDLPLSIDDALRFVVSGGVIMPISQELSDSERQEIRLGALSGGASQGTSKKE